MTSLTPREQDILESYPRHGTYKNIAWELGIRPQTVANHVKSILAKLDAASLGQAAVLFDRMERQRWPAVERRVVERRGGGAA